MSRAQRDIDAANKRWLERAERKWAKPAPNVQNMLDMKATYTSKPPKAYRVMRG